MARTGKSAGDSEREDLVPASAKWPLTLDACPGGESPAFPREQTAPLNLLALERRRLIFPSGVDKGRPCPGVQGLR